MDILKRFFGGQRNTSVTPIDPRYLELIQRQFGIINWSEARDETFLDQGYKLNPNMYSVVQLIAKNAAMIPLCVYKVKDESKLRRYKSLSSGAAIDRAEIEKRYALEATGQHPLQSLLNNPNSRQDCTEFFEELYSFLLVFGNSFTWGIGPETGPNSGKPNELWNLPSQDVQIHASQTKRMGIEGYSLDWYTSDNKETVPIKEGEMMHCKYSNLDYDEVGSQWYGQAPMYAAIRSLDTNNDAITAARAYIKNQGPQGIVTPDANTTMPFNKAQAKELRDAWRRNRKGADKAGDLAIIPTPVSFTPIGIAAADIQLLEQYMMGVRDICNIYHVPSELLNDKDGGTFNNMKEAKKALYQNAVIPLLCKVRGNLNRWLAPKYGNNVYIDFDLSAVAELQEDVAKQVDYLYKAYWLTENEKREWMGLSKDYRDETMDSYYRPANLLGSHEERPEPGGSFGEPGGPNNEDPNGEGK